MSDIQIKQVRSAIGSIPKQRATLKSLGLRRINHVVTKKDTPQVRGMIKKVIHLVEIMS